MPPPPTVRPSRLAVGRLPRPLRHPRMRPLVRRLSKAFTAVERRRVRSGRRSIGGWVAGDAPALLLTTVGRRTGRRRTTPLLFHRRSDHSLLLVAVNGCADWAPDWLHNLMADPAVDVEIGPTRRAGRARVLDAAERAASWDEACQAFPGLRRAQEECGRPIPLIRVTST